MRVIYYDESIIGDVQDIIEDVAEEVKRGSVDDLEMTNDLFESLKGFSGVVECWYNPAGAWSVRNIKEINE